MIHDTAYKRILQLSMPYRWLLLAAMFCMIIEAALSTTQAYMVKPLLDKIFVEKNEAMLLILPVAIMVLFVVKGGFYYCYAYLMDLVGQTIIKNLRGRLFNHIITQPLSFLQKNPTGELISRIMNDVSLLQFAVSSSLVSIIRDAFKVVGLLGYIIYQDWQLSLLSLLFLPLSIYAIANFGRRYRRYSTRMQQSTAQVTTILQETIAGNRIVKAFCNEEYETDRLNHRLDELFAYTMKNTKLRSFSRPLMEVLGGLGIALIMWYGGSRVMSGQSTPGTFFSFLAALIMIYEPIKSLSSVNNTVQQGIAASIRIFDLLDIPNEFSDKAERLEYSALPSPLGTIEFRNVSFSYDGKNNVLSDINLTAKAGDIIALVGTSGGGKTTLVNLLPRFYEASEGEILLDGKDIRDFSLSSLRQQIGIVSQETILFNDTVRANIAYGDAQRSDEEIEAAAQAAHALDFINQLPQQFETIIGESGSRLSGGQRQRISIARALLKNAPILILDEATSALDTESEREVQNALENLMKNRTTFVIAHRLSTVKKADRILVLQDGQIVEEGSHEDLLQKRGTYEMLHQMQN